MSTPPESGLQALQPPGWPPPKGYANGYAGTGRLVVVGGQIGWDETGRFPAGDLVGQARQALCNIVAVLKEAGARPEHVARLTWYVTDIAEYRTSLRALGQAYREVMGTHFPAMTLVQVVALVEPEARVEIEATAIIPPESGGR
ncbi:RidA family protein [Azospirillum sp. TSO22-1]|uniref:RidA family protein n=1 Tax=Azospirillum sp. TSO22-1 TaxID=716789 RepID=UPI000D615419|nr:RidA family protein [Azospirillum sp. TSO22-1]PWC41704.1 endoribonuclease L-PSP [Azospirillum sp. TSO22-1]